jgi:poly(hydroxyalkanoate) granule-associated protein
MTNAEEIEVNVRQIDEPAPTANPGVQVFEVMRKLMLAGFGAFALTREEAEALLNRLVDRGEIAQKDAQKIMDETMARFRTTAQPTVNQAEHAVTDATANVNNLAAGVTSQVNTLTAGVTSQVSSLTSQMESNLEQLLNRLNIPSKRDIDELSAKIAQLAARVEELRRSQETSGRAKVYKAPATHAEEDKA